MLSKNNKQFKALVFLSLLALCYCAPQRYGAQSNYYNRYQSPYRRANYDNAYRRSQQTSATVPWGYNNNIDYNRRTPTTRAPRATTTEDPFIARRRYRDERQRQSRAEAQNAKFGGAANQETTDAPAENTRTLNLLSALRRGGVYSDRCLPYGRGAVARDAASKTKATSSVPNAQGRFLFDLNVYNVYGGGGGLGGAGAGLPFADCGSGLAGLAADYLGLGGGQGSGLGGGGLGSGIYGDQYYPNRRRPLTPLASFLQNFAPGILQNSLAATVPTPGLADPIYGGGSGGAGELNDLQNDPAVSPGYRPQAQYPVRRPTPNRVYYDSMGAVSGGVPPISPAQLVGGVASTVNGIIQQLTGNVQPVYG